jgi:hypothetical protein
MNPSEKSPARARTRHTHHSHESICPESKLLWNLFFLFAGIAPNFVWSSFTTLSKFWTDAYSPQITPYIPFAYIAGQLLTIPLYFLNTKLLSFKLQTVLYPTLKLLTFYFHLLLASYLFPNQTQTSEFQITSSKTLTFLTIVLIQGSISNLIFFTFARFILYFGLREVTLFAIGLLIPECIDYC